MYISPDLYSGVMFIQHEHSTPESSDLIFSSNTVVKICEDLKKLRSICPRQEFQYPIIEERWEHWLEKSKGSPILVLNWSVLNGKSSYFFSFISPEAEVYIPIEIVDKELLDSSKMKYSDTNSNVIPLPRYRNVFIYNIKYENPCQKCKNELGCIHTFKYICHHCECFYFNELKSGIEHMNFVIHEQNHFIFPWWLDVFD